MTDVTLHLRAEDAALCVVCGADLSRPVSSWWLHNTWTRDQRYYHDGETSLPGQYSRRCEVLPQSASGTPNAAHIPSP